MADANAALIALACVQGATTIALTGATAFYAVRTHNISKATREQANATAKMAQEMREQSLAADRPYLLVDIPRLDCIEFKEPAARQDGQPDPHIGFPTEIVYRVFNAGKGPAKEIGTSIRHPAVRYQGVSKDVLRSGDSWDVAIEPQAEAAALIADSFEESAPKGLSDYLERCGAVPLEPGYDCGIVVTYADINEQQYVTYLRFGMIAVTDEVRKKVTSRTIRPYEQRILRLESSKA